MYVEIQIIDELWTTATVLNCIKTMVKATSSQSDFKNEVKIDNCQIPRSDSEKSKSMGLT